MEALWWCGGAGLLVWAVLFDLREQKRRRAKPAPSPSRDKLSFIAPFDEHDWFCTCPKCYTTGYHSVTVSERSWPREIRDPVTRDYIGLTTWQGPKRSWYALRECWNCGHNWETPASKPGT